MPSFQVHVIVNQDLRAFIMGLGLSMSSGDRPNEADALRLLIKTTADDMRRSDPILYEQMTTLGVAEMVRRRMLAPPRE